MEEFLPWVVKFHSEDLSATEHTIGNVLIRIEEEDAYSEARVDVCLRLKGESGFTDLILAGRYLDKWQRRDGVWRIYDRIALVDFYRTHPVVQDAASKNIMEKAIFGSRDNQDLSYKYV